MRRFAARFLVGVGAWGAFVALAWAAGLT